MPAMKDTLLTVLSKLQGQYTNTALALKQAEGTIQQADEADIAAAKVLIAKFGNPQGTVQIIQNVYQIDALKEVLDEIAAMMAGIQSTVINPASMTAAEAQLQANVESTQSPLPQSGASSGTDSVADAGSSSEVATPSA